jgi:ABC-type transport system substrate-binding protein
LSRPFATISLLLLGVLAALPARSARRPHYGGTLRVEISAVLASLEPNLPASTPEESAAKAQIDALIYDHRDAEGPAAGALGSGPFRVANWVAGKSLALAANDGFPQGRPFVDSIEITMGRSSRDRLLDLQLNNTDFAEIPPQDARSASEHGVRTSISKPDELLALIFNNPDSMAVRNLRIREALAQSIDRAAIVNFILQKTGEPAGALLPQWSSGTAFLFTTAADSTRAKELWSQISSSQTFVLGYDAADPLGQSIAERIVVNAKEAGIPVTAQAIPRLEKAPAASSLRRVDAQLIRWRMPSPLPGDALKSFVDDYAPELKIAGALSATPGTLADSPSPQDIYDQQRAILTSYAVIPLVWLPRVYGLSARVRNWAAPDVGEPWPLADVWLDTDATAGKQ